MLWPREASFGTFGSYITILFRTFYADTLSSIELRLTVLSSQLAVPAINLREWCCMNYACMTRWSSFTTFSDTIPASGLHMNLLPKFLVLVPSERASRCATPTKLCRPSCQFNKEVVLHEIDVRGQEQVCLRLLVATITFVSDFLCLHGSLLDTVRIKYCTHNLQDK